MVVGCNMKLSYGWVVVGAGMLMTCIGIGAMISLAVFLQPIAADTGWSRSGISTAATLDFLCMGAAAFLWGMLSDRFGTRIVVLLGSALLGLGLVAASRATTLIEFQLLFGVVDRRRRRQLLCADDGGRDRSGSSIAATSRSHSSPPAWASGP